MGLDFSHTDAHWAYSGFHRFREALAAHEGFDLNTMQGFGGTRPWSEIATPLKPLLNHSDCEDELSPKDCAPVAARLREVLPLIWPDLDAFDRRHGLLLAEGMETASAAGEPLEFC